MSASSPQFDPTQDFRDQLKEVFRNEQYRFWYSFRITDKVSIAVQASKAHHCLPQQTFDDPMMYSAWEVIVYKEAVPKMQVHYLETPLVQRLLLDVFTDFGRIELSPLRPLEPK